MTAAVFMTPVTIPTDRTKCLLQIQSQPGAQKFNGPIDCLWKLYSSGGITNLYKGGGVAVLLEIPAAAVYFSTYEAVKGEHIPERGYIARVLLAGGLAGAMSWVITLPVDFVKSRVMTSCTKYVLVFLCTTIMPNFCLVSGPMWCTPNYKNPIFPCTIPCDMLSNANAELQISLDSRKRRGN